MELFKFGNENNVWKSHGRNPDGTGEKCFGRIMRLAYPFGWNHYYCQEKCCDRTGQKDNETGEDLGKTHVACTTAFTYVDYYYCMDCSKIGVA